MASAAAPQPQAAAAPATLPANGPIYIDTQHEGKYSTYPIQEALAGGAVQFASRFH